MYNPNDYVFFWAGTFSNFYPAMFTVKYISIEGNIYSGETFNCTEQYYMYCKALTFGDFETAEAILKATTPKEQKRLGRQVKGFDADFWNQVSRGHMYDANYAKYKQNPGGCLKELFATEGKTLVEASPYDLIWGIGLAEEAAKVTPADKWPGTNWLGQVLTELRDNLLAERDANDERSVIVF